MPPCRTACAHGCDGWHVPLAAPSSIPQAPHGALSCYCPLQSLPLTKPAPQSSPARWWSTWRRVTSCHPSSGWKPAGGVNLAFLRIAGMVSSQLTRLAVTAAASTVAVKLFEHDAMAKTSSTWVAALWPTRRGPLAPAQMHHAGVVAR